MTVNTHFIDMIDAAFLKIVCPERKLSELEVLVEPFKKACVKYEIVSIRRVAAFIAQMSTESLLVYDVQENLNYSADGLAATWPNRYAINPKSTGKKIPNDLAKKLHRKPEAIANNVYADRMGNGNEASGDGWRFRGTGLKQLTGLRNWYLFGLTVMMTALEAIVYGRTLEGSVMSAAWFWNTNGLNDLAETPGVEDETKRINGGYNGLEDRRTRFNNGVNELLRRERLARGIIK
jgi:putative chitinase